MCIWTRTHLSVCACTALHTGVHLFMHAYIYSCMHIFSCIFLHNYLRRNKWKPLNRAQSYTHHYDHHSVVKQKMIDSSLPPVVPAYQYIDYQLLDKPMPHSLAISDRNIMAPVRSLNNAMHINAMVASTFHLFSGFPSSIHAVFKPRYSSLAFVCVTLQTQWYLNKRVRPLKVGS